MLVRKRSFFLRKCFWRRKETWSKERESLFLGGGGKAAVQQYEPNLGHLSLSVSQHTSQFIGTQSSHNFSVDRRSFQRQVENGAAAQNSLNVYFYKDIAFPLLYVYIRIYLCVRHSHHCYTVLRDCGNHCAIFFIIAGKRRGGVGVAGGGEEKA